LHPIRMQHCLLCAQRRHLVQTPCKPSHKKTSVESATASYRPGPVAGTGDAVQLCNLSCHLLPVRAASFQNVTRSARELLGDRRL